MSDLSTQIAVLETQMKQVIKQVDDGFTKNSEQHQEMMNAFNRAMEQKAGKWVEKVLVGAGSVIGVALLGALLALILQ